VHPEAIVVNIELEREVRERRLTAVLEEAAGGGAPPALAERVLARVRAEPAPRRSQRRATLVAALLMVAGIAVVVATALSRGDAPEVQAQDPSPPGNAAEVTVTTAMVRDTCKPLHRSPPPGKAAARLSALADGAPFGLVLAPGVRGESKVDVADLTAHDAVVSVAAELGVGVSEFGAMMVVGIGPAASAARLRCSLRARSVDVRDLGELLHSWAGINLVVAGEVAGRVTFSVDDPVSPRALLDVVAHRLGLEVVGCGTVFALRRAKQGREPVQKVPDFGKEGEWGDLLDTVAHAAGGNFVIDPAVKGSVYLRTNSAARDEVVTALAAAVGADVRQLDRGMIHVVAQLGLPADLDLVAENVPDYSLLVETSDAKVTVDAPGMRDVRVAVAKASALDVLRAAAVATGRSLVRTDSGYTIR
jgi:hypothetical protein